MIQSAYDFRHQPDPANPGATVPAPPGPGWFYGALLREVGPLYSTRDAALAAPPADRDTGGTRA